MSKICGMVSTYFSGSALRSKTLKMAHLMKHLDGHRIDQWNDEYAGFGHLSIGAVNEEPQPIFSAHSKKNIIFAGKIFGYESLREELIRKGHRFNHPGNDAEFVLHLYEEYGTKRFAKLNGIFAFSIWDPEKKELLLVNDRYGMRPVYYTYDEGRNMLAFASELKSISRVALTDKKINWEGWNVFLRLGFFIDDDTFFQNVYFLPAASILRFDLQNITIEPYWDCTKIYTKNSFDETEDVRHLVDLFQQSMKRRTLPDKKMAVFLSGGPDSSGIAAELKRRDVPFTSYTTRKFNKFDEDQRSAEFIAKLLNIENHFYDLPEDFMEVYEPLKNRLLDYQCSEHTWLLPLLEVIPADTKINFDGLGFDFMCDTCMYDRSHIAYRDMLESRRYEDFIKEWYYSPTGYHSLLWPIKGGKSDFVFLSKNIRHKFSYESFTTKIKKALAKVEDTKAPYVFFHLTTRARRCVATSVFGLIINRLESFCPYLDNDFFDYLMSLPLSARLNRTLRTKILGDAYPQLFSDNSCLVGNNIKNFVEYHHNFYPQKVRYLSQMAINFLLTFRSDIYNPVYVLPRVIKDIVISRLYLTTAEHQKRTRYYNRLHHKLIPPLYALNRWLQQEKIKRFDYDTAA
jgi:asparagine synthase (glutamine-hydrolysing)